MPTQATKTINDGKAAFPIETPSYTTIIETVSENISYIGQAKCGSYTTEGKTLEQWRIQKIEVDGDLEIVTWAEGDDNFNKIWNDRATYTYS